MAALWFTDCELFIQESWSLEKDGLSSLIAAKGTLLVAATYRLYFASVTTHKLIAKKHKKIAISDH